MIVNTRELQLIKDEVISDLKTFVSKLDMKEITKHNYGYRQYKFEDFVLHQQWYWDTVIDYYNTHRSDCTGISDIGTFVPYYPAVLKKIGFNVEVVEKLDLYGDRYASLLTDYLTAKDIPLIDFDNVSKSGAGYDILMIAMLEHLSGSPRELLETVKTKMTPQSIVYIIVPNMCRFYNVTNIIRGRSPLPKYDNYYFSSYPFSGHNRPMTLQEVTHMAEYSGIEIIDKGYINKPFMKSFQYPINDNIGRIIPRFSDSIFLIGKLP